MEAPAMVELGGLFGYTCLRATPDRVELGLVENAQSARGKEDGNAGGDRKLEQKGRPGRPR